MSEQMDALVKEYNELTGKNIKRFSSLAAGQERLDRVRAGVKVKRAPMKKRLSEKKSGSVRSSWDDENIAKKRAMRYSVTVNGVAYGSMKQAFDALKIVPVNGIVFRKKLFEAGTAVYEHNGEKITLTATPKTKETQSK